MPFTATKKLRNQDLSLHKIAENTFLLGEGDVDYVNN